jgi:hypothetical protein
VAGTPPDDGKDLDSGGSSEQSFDLAAAPKPWFLKPWVLGVWGVLVITLIAVIIWGLLELAHGSGGGKPATTKPSTTTTTSSTPTTTTTTTSTTAPTSSTPPSSTDETPTVAPPSTAPAPGTAPSTHGHPHRHWWTDLPTTRLPGFPP